MQGWGKVVAKLHVGEGLARESSKASVCVCPQLNSLSGSGCTLCCSCACLCGGYECGFERQRRHCDDSVLHHWHWQRQTHTQREREQTQAYGGVVFPCTSVWVWSLSEVGYIMTKCERSPTGSSTVPLCSLRNIPALPFPQFLSFTYLQSVFPLQAYTAIPWFHSMSFFSVYLCAQLFWLSE